MMKLALTFRNDSRHQPDDGIPDRMRDIRLRTRRDRAGEAVGSNDHGLAVGGVEHPALADVVDHEQVATLAFELRAGVVHDGAVRVSGLGGEADDDRALARARLYELGED